MSVRLPRTFPLPAAPLSDALARQFWLLECTARHSKAPSSSRRAPG